MHSVLPVLQFSAKSSLSHHSWQEPTIAHCWRCFQPRQLYEHRFHKSHHSGSHTWNVQVIWPHIKGIRYTFLSCPQNTFGAISDVRFSKITKYAQPFFSIFSHVFRGVLTSPTQSMSPRHPDGLSPAAGVVNPLGNLKPCGSWESLPPSFGVDVSIVFRSKVYGKSQEWIYLKYVYDI